MKRKKSFFITFIAILLVSSIVTPTVMAAGNSRRAAILSGADRVCELQRDDTGWEGTWYWYVGSDYNATNLTGVTALGLLEAYQDTKNTAYLDAAMQAASFIMIHLGTGATDQYHVRTTAPDIVFLYKLSEVTGNSAYATRAYIEWVNITNYYPQASALDALFRSINRQSAWDIAFFLEAAYLSGDTVWADGAAAILADTTDEFYYSDSTWWYALNLAGSVRALVGCGYAGQYYDAFISLLSDLISLIDTEDGIGGWIQDTAYAVIALNSVGGAARKYANDLGRWLANQQEENGGWLEGGDEYPEIDGEALRALSGTIGTNVTIDGFEPGVSKNSAWIKFVNEKAAIPFNGD